MREVCSEFRAEIGWKMQKNLNFSAENLTLEYPKVSKRVYGLS